MVQTYPEPAARDLVERKLISKRTYEGITGNEYKATITENVSVWRVFHGGNRLFDARLADSQVQEIINNGNELDGKQSWAAICMSDPNYIITVKL